MSNNPEERAERVARAGTGFLRYLRTGERPTAEEQRDLDELNAETFAAQCAECPELLPLVSQLAEQSKLTIAANVEPRIRALAEGPGDAARFCGLPVQFSLFMEPDTWLLWEAGRPVKLGRFRPDSLEEHPFSASLPTPAAA